MPIASALNVTVDAESANGSGLGTRVNDKSREALSLLLLHMCASHQTGTSGIVEQSYNPNCPAGVYAG